MRREFRTINVKAPLKTDWKKTAQVNGSMENLQKIFWINKISCWRGYIQRSKKRNLKFNSEKEKAYFDDKLKVKIANRKKNWKTLQQLGLPNKRFSFPGVCLKKKKIINTWPFRYICIISKILFNNFGIQPVSIHYTNIIKCVKINLHFKKSS